MNPLARIAIFPPQGAPATPNLIDAPASIEVQGRKFACQGKCGKDMPAQAVAAYESFAPFLDLLAGTTPVAPGAPSEKPGPLLFQLPTEITGENLKRLSAPAYYAPDLNSVVCVATTWKDPAQPLAYDIGGNTRHELGHQLDDFLVPELPGETCLSFSATIGEAYVDHWRQGLTRAGLTVEDVNRFNAKYDFLLGCQTRPQGDYEHPTCVVQEGQTLSQLLETWQKRHGVDPKKTVEDLVKFNSLTDPNFVKAGLTLRFYSDEDMAIIAAVRETEGFARKACAYFTGTYAATAHLDRSCVLTSEYEKSKAVFDRILCEFFADSWETYLDPARSARLKTMDYWHWKALDTLYRHRELGLTLPEAMKRFEEYLRRPWIRLEPYTVVAGDVLGIIARRNRPAFLSPDERQGLIVEINGIRNPDLIRPGQTFLLPVE